MTKTILITGASSGIGKATAIKFAENGWNLILTARRGHLLTELAETLQQQYSVNITNLVFDVRNQKEVARNIEHINNLFPEINVLVNNAGLAVGLDPFDKALIDDWETMIDTNVKGLLYVTKALIPKMIKQGNGHIINIGSIAGKETYANGNVYCATKHAVDSLTKAMRIDLLQYGIKVSQICPGAINTEFSLVRFKGDKQKADKVYEGYKPLDAADVADAIYYIANLPEHVNINDMVIMPTAQASPYHVFKKD